VISLKERFDRVKCTFLPVSCNLPVKLVVLVIVSSLSRFLKTIESTISRF